MPTLYAHTIYIVWTTCHIWCGRLSSTPYSSPHYIFKGSVSTPYVTCCPHYIQMFSTPYTHTIYYPVWNRHPHTISKNPPHYIMWICSPYKFNGVDNMSYMVWTTPKIIWCGRYGVDNQKNIWCGQHRCSPHHIWQFVHTIYIVLHRIHPHHILYTVEYYFTCGVEIYCGLLQYIVWSTKYMVWRYSVDYSIYGVEIYCGLLPYIVWIYRVDYFHI